MVIEVYDKWLAAPLNCGSRYLSKLNMDIVHSNTNELHYSIDNPFMELEWFVIRNPIEHLQIALHAECLPHFDNPMEVKRVLNTFIEESINSNYHRELYYRVFEYWRQSNRSFEFVELSRLSYTMDTKGYHQPFYVDDYNFGHYNEKWKSKEEVYEMVKSGFREEWDVLMEYAMKDLHYYQKCQSGIVELT